MCPLPHDCYMVDFRNVSPVLSTTAIPTPIGLPSGRTDSDTPLTFLVSIRVDCLFIGTIYRHTKQLLFTLNKWHP